MKESLIKQGYTESRAQEIIDNGMKTWDFAPPSWKR